MPRRVPTSGRKFPENGLDVLLDRPANLGELLAISEAEERHWIDLPRAERERATFIGLDYRRQESDFLFRVPLLRPYWEGSRRAVWLYLLLEHQTKPDPLIALRLLEYYAHVCRFQLRRWLRSGGRVADFVLQPILPVVLYTGEREWDHLPTLADLMAASDLFSERTPLWKPEFINVGGLSEALLESEGGAFGWVLRLLHQRHASAPEFRTLLDRAVTGLEARVTAAERERILELFSYLVALVYNERAAGEIQPLQQRVEAAVQTDWLKAEVRTMGRTMADVLRAEGRKEGEKRGAKIGTLNALRQTLRRQLERRFGALPASVAATIDGCKRPEQLGAWLDRFAEVNTLDEMGITPA